MNPHAPKYWTTIGRNTIILQITGGHARSLQKIPLRIRVLSLCSNPWKLLAALGTNPLQMERPFCLRIAPCHHIILHEAFHDYWRRSVLLYFQSTEQLYYVGGF